MIIKNPSTRMYGKLIREYLKDIEIDTDGLKGTVKITRLKEY